METSLPDDLTLSLSCTVASTSELASTLTSALEAGGLRAVERWLIPRDAKVQTGDWRAALEELVARPAQAPGGSEPAGRAPDRRAPVRRAPDGRLHLGGGQVVDLAAQSTNVPGTGVSGTGVQGTGVQGTGVQSTDVQSTDVEYTRWRVVLHTAPDKSQPSRFPALLQLHASFCRRWMQAIPVESGLLQWSGGGARCLPGVPLVGERSHLVVTTQAQIEEAYDAPQAFLRAGWEGSESFGPGPEPTLMLTRAMDVTSSAGYLRAVLPHQWTLAHAAKPKRTRYELPNPLPAEQAVYNAGEQTLHIRGYRAGEKVMEYNCFPAGAAHMPGWEVLGLYGVLRRGALPDGLPVAGVQVYFQQKELALREKRPLIDIGVTVAYNAAGRWVDIVE